MPKKTLASLELSAIVNELQFLAGGKVSQIYHQEKKEFLLQLHSPREGKVFLKIVPGKFLCLTENKEVPLRPSGFCMQLRKHLNNASIKSIYQKDAERIVVLELEKKERFYFIIELFSKGNIILADENYKIIGVLERQIWKDRVVKPHEIYIFPKSETNWKLLDEDKLCELIKKSEKKNLATCLAMEIGLGGLYAEEICKINSIDKDKKPGMADNNDISKIIQTIHRFSNMIKMPSGNIYEEEITPFPLAGKMQNETKNSYNEAINTLNPFEIISPYNKRINTLQIRIKQQEEAIKKLEEKISQNTAKGELIYENYAPLQKLLDIIQQMRKEGREWREVTEELKKVSKIKSINLKEKKVVIDL